MGFSPVRPSVRPGVRPGFCPWAHPGPAPRCSCPQGRALRTVPRTGPSLPPVIISQGDERLILLRSCGFLQTHSSNYLAGSAPAPPGQRMFNARESLSEI